MSAQTIDYDALAQQHGGTAAVDYDALAAQHGGAASGGPDSAAKRLGTNFLSGAGVTSNEQAKNFFTHPLDTVIKSFEAQGELAKKARDAYNRGDYMEALQHGLNYLVPFVGQQTDQAGTQLKQGDIAGGIGRTLGAALPMVAGSPEVQTVASDAASAAAQAGARGVRAATRGANIALAKAPGTVGATVGAGVGGHFGGAVGAEVGAAAGALAGKELLPQLRIPGEGFALPSRVTGGPADAPQFAAPAAQPEAPPTVQPQPAAVAAPPAQAAPPAPAPAAAPTTAAILQEKLNDALGGRPIQPGVSMRNQAAATGAKLPDGFTATPDSSVLKGYKYNPSAQEFDAITNTGQRFRHGQVTPDQFKAFEENDSPGKGWNDLRNGAGVTPLGKVNADGVLQPRIKPRSVVVDPTTGAREFSDVLEAKQNAAQATPTPKAKAATASAGADDEDLTSVWQQSLDQVKASR